MLNYFVSYKLKGWHGLCGNQSFTDSELAKQFIIDNKHNWASWGIGTFKDEHFVNDITPIPAGHFLSTFLPLV